MRKRRNPRLAYCEYVLSDSQQSIATEIARRDLMRKVRDLHRPMLEALAAEVLPHYAKLVRSGFDLEVILWNPRICPSLAIPDGELKSALQFWARKFHAEADWFLDDTLRTLRGWHVAPEWRDGLRWNPIGQIVPTLAVGDPFLFHVEGWEMQLLTWSDYSRSLRERFEQQVREYEASSRRLAESRGLVRAPHKYSPVNLDWFVLYQFANLSSTAIANQSANDNPSDDSTVLKGIKAAAALLGWEHLRPSKKSHRKI